MKRKKSRAKDETKSFDLSKKKKGAILVQGAYQGFRLDKLSFKMSIGNPSRCQTGSQFKKVLVKNINLKLPAYR